MEQETIDNTGCPDGSGTPEKNEAQNKSPKKNEFLIRTLTGASVTLVCAAVLCLSGYPYVLRTAVAVLCVIGVYELLNIVSSARPAYVIGFGIITACAQFLPLGNYLYLISVLLIAAQIIFVYMMVRAGTYKFTKIYHVFPFILLFAVFARSACELRDAAHGLYLLVMIFVATELNDIFAYIVGSRIGRHRFAPKISPSKTVEGTVGGLVCSLTVVLLIAAFIGKKGGIKVQLPWLALWLFAAGIEGQFGDLAFSSIKRAAGAKDFGTLLPGHGGLLDRFDSLLFSLPTFYILTAVFPQHLFK